MTEFQVVRQGKEPEAILPSQLGDVLIIAAVLWPGKKRLAVQEVVPRVVELQVLDRRFAPYARRKSREMRNEIPLLSMQPKKALMFRARVPLHLGMELVN